ncbi:MULTISPECIES: recombinase family protein [Cytobacillus]|uniref:recombinase family protein n=1 Tax=Cytobacillus TaxID=2675230 RepID=UPI001C2ECFE7|nr:MULTISPECIES: recombinase family protein [Cytobacillus]
MQKDINNLAAVYVRVSTLKESQKDSPEHQKSICLQKAKMEDLEVRPEFIYEDRSTGTNIMERDDIKLLIEDAKKGYFSTVIFTSLSRFSRDSLDALALKRTLVDALEIRLISINDNYDSKENGNDEMIFTIMSAVNQKLSQQISVSSRAGIRESALKGNFTGSTAPYGYRKITKVDEKSKNKVKTLEVDDKKADIVRKIFNLYINGMGEKKIIEYLNHEEIPSPRNEKWGITTVQRMLQNEAYTGRNVHGKYTVKKVTDVSDVQNRRNKLVQVPKEKWERNEQIEWEPIITDKIFEDAQKIRLNRGGGKRGGVRNVKVNPFSGLVKCAHCGSSYVSMKSGKVGKKGQEYRYLICSSRRRIGTKGCINDLWAPFEEFKEGVLQTIKLELEKKVNIDEVSAGLEIPTTNDEKANKNKRKKLEGQLKQNRTLLMNLRKEFNLEKIDKGQFEFEKETYEAEIKDIQEELKNLEETSKTTNNLDYIKSQVHDGLQRLVNLNFVEIDELQLVLKQLIEVITVNKDGVVLIRTPLGTIELENLQL